MREIPFQITLDAWIDGHARRRPDGVALIEEEPDGQRRVGWLELSEGSVRVAAALAARGVEPGDRVAWWLPNGVAAIELLIACARLGAIALPLNTRLSATELAAQLADAAPRVVVYEPEGQGARILEGARALAHLQAPVGPAVAVDALADGGRTPGFAPHPSQPALLLYTSGSSARPRGVLLTHRACAASHIQFIEALRLGSDDVHYAVAPLFHIAGLHVLTVPALMVGATVVLDDRFEPARAIAQMRAHRVTRSFMVPQMWARLADHLGQGEQVPAADLPGGLLRGVVGGAPTPAGLVERLRDHGVELLQGYGMTEAGPMVAIEHVGEARTPGTVGRPGRLVDVRISSVGEILVRAPNLMRGYWQDPVATAARLRDGWLHTGDLGRFDGEHLRVVGRLSDMVVSGGENVAAAEVEDVLRLHPAVAEVAVVATPCDRWGEAVTAVVVPRGAPPSLDELREFAGQHIARYKLPLRLVTVGALPQTGSGKVDKAALRAWLATFESMGSLATAPEACRG